MNIGTKDARTGAASAATATSVLHVRERCPGCGRVGHSELFSVPFSDARLASYLRRHYDGRCDLGSLADERWEIDQCVACRLIFQARVPGPELLTEIYNEWIGYEARDQLRARYTLKKNYRYWASQIDTLIQHVDKPPYKVRILDFGMGWSEWANMARAFGCDVYGAEISVERIVYGRSIGIPVLSWEEIPGREFDYINTEQVFEHLVDPLGTLRYLASGLARSGTIRISVPDGRRALSIIQTIAGSAPLPPGALMLIAPFEHINCFDHATLDALGRAAGLRPKTPSLFQMFDAAAGWFSLRGAATNVLRPIYRHVYPRSTIGFFGHARA